jgi:FlaA1/EpsC-like NDP-sugar epimerase
MLRSLTVPTGPGAKLLSTVAKLKNKEIAIWGAGQYCYRLLSHTPLSSSSVRFIVDRDEKKHGKKILGMRVMSPEVLKNFEGTIVVCSTTAKEQIINDIQQMGLTNLVVVPFG